MVELTDNHKTLLATGLSRGERIGEPGSHRYKNAILYYEDAVALYSTEEAAVSVLTTLQFKGYIETTDMPGRFIIVNAPEECHLRADILRKRRHEREDAMK